MRWTVVTSVVAAACASRPSPEVILADVSDVGDAASRAVAMGTLPIAVTGCTVMTGIAISGAFQFTRSRMPDGIDETVSGSAVTDARDGGPWSCDVDANDHLSGEQITTISGTVCGEKIFHVSD